MYVCVCKAITETQVRAAADDGALTLKDIAKLLGAATECGKCGTCVREVLLSHPHAPPEQRDSRSTEWALAS